MYLVLAGLSGSGRTSRLEGDLRLSLQNPAESLKSFLGSGRGKCHSQDFFTLSLWEIYRISLFSFNTNTFMKCLCCRHGCDDRGPCLSVVLQSDPRWVQKLTPLNLADPMLMDGCTVLIRHLRSMSSGAGGVKTSCLRMFPGRLWTLRIEPRSLRLALE